jgi:predicted nucleotidyltransferase
MMSSDQVRAEIVATIRRYIPSRELRIRLFGSRAAGTFTPVSDFDVALDMGRRIDGAIMERIRGDLEDSDIPYRVDIVDLASTTSTFRSVAMAEAVPW